VTLQGMVKKEREKGAGMDHLKCGG